MSTIPDVILGVVEQRLLNLIGPTTIRKVMRLHNPVLETPQKDAVHFYLEGETSEYDAECINSTFTLVIFVGFEDRTRPMDKGWELTAAVNAQLFSDGHDTTLGGIAIAIREGSKDILPTELTDPEYIAELRYDVVIARTDGNMYA